MRVPIRKPGKYTHQKADHNLTQFKLDELKQKLAKLKASRPNAAKEVKRLAELGDLSENAAYQIAKGRLRSINQRIIDQEKYINSAVVIKPIGNALVVGLGQEVIVEINGNPLDSARGRQKTFLILGSLEANPDKGIISHNSPIGSALMGRRVGDVVEVKQRNLPDGRQDKIIKCKIVNII